ncbi:MAG TPA: MXAN_5187 family protein [Polyangiaceae bacterium]|nr:MXAN_5187 family protein [Polyangiaceae bacterium]
MVLSRFWYVLLGLLFGAALFLLHIASSMYNRAGLRARAEGLSSDAQVVSWYLRDDARQRSAQLIPFALEPDVAKYLQKSNESEAKVPEDARGKLTQALQRVSAQIPKDAGFDSVFAVDQNGRVVAYVGYEQASGMEDFELGGYPVVADALHGYVRDDTLVLDRMYRVVARPVEFDLAAMPAGAIVGARVIDDRFARELSQRTGAAVAFYANGQRAAAASPAEFNTANLDAIVGDLTDLEQDKDYREKGRSAVREIGGMIAVQYTRLPGEAWQLGAGYAVARLPAAVSGPLAFFSKADDKDKKAGNLPLAIAAAVLAAGLGILFSFLEHTRPLQVFKLEAGKFAAGTIEQLTPSHFRGLFRKIASDVNDGVDKQLAKGGGPRRGPADFKQVLGDIPDQPVMSAFSLPGDAQDSAASGPGSGAVSVPMSSGTSAQGAGRPLPSPPGSAPRRLPRPPGAAPAAAPAPAPAAHLEASMPEGGLTEWGSGAADESEWQDVFREFVATKKQCGETVDGFTYEKFAERLRKNRDALVQRHGAKRVKFGVYVKDGKAALKANPIKE